AALFTQTGLHAGGGVEAEGRAARQNDGVDALHGAVGLEQVGLARSRRAAAHVDRSNRWRIEQDCGYPGSKARIMCLPDQDTGDVGDEIACRQISAVGERARTPRSRYLSPGCIDHARLT